MLSENTIRIVKEITPLVAANAETITRRFYERLFEANPEVKAFFNQAHQHTGGQQKALAGAICAYFTHIDNPAVLLPAVELIAQKHASLGIQAEHYPIVGTCLLAAIKDVLGAAATDDIINAWAEAYQQLADILIAAEEQIYAEKAASQGGWRGTRAFRVARKQVESGVITSFYLEPVDGGALMAFVPGQYVTVLLTVDGQPLRRNYSLFDAPGKSHYRISVKREPHGVASNYLHDAVKEGDTLEVLAPSGEFQLTTATRPLVLLTGGVGITPAISMLDVAAASGRPVEFIHAALNSKVHAFRAHVDRMALQYPNVRPFFVYNDALAEDHPHARGLVTKELLAARLPADRDVDLYFLGPKPFMQSVYRSATELGIPAGQIKFEFFGPLEDLNVAAADEAA